MAKTPKEKLIWSLRLEQIQLASPPPAKTLKEKLAKESRRVTHVRLFNQRLEEAKTLASGVDPSEWPPPWQDTGFGGLTQYLCSWAEIAARNSQLLVLLEKTMQPAESTESVPPDGSSPPISSALDPARPRESAQPAGHPHDYDHEPVSIPDRSRG